MSDNEYLHSNLPPVTPETSDPIGQYLHEVTDRDRRQDSREAAVSTFQQLQKQLWHTHVEQILKPLASPLLETGELLSLDSPQLSDTYQTAYGFMGDFLGAWDYEKWQETPQGLLHLKTKVLATPRPRTDADRQELKAAEPCIRGDIETIFPEPLFGLTPRDTLIGYRLPADEVRSAVGSFIAQNPNLLRVTITGGLTTDSESRTFYDVKVDSKWYDPETPAPSFSPENAETQLDELETFSLTAMVSYLESKLANEDTHVSESQVLKQVNEIIRSSRFIPAPKKEPFKLFKRRQL